MSIPRFYCTDLLVVGNEVIFHDEIHHRIAHVLRKKVGDDVLLFDGNGQSYDGTIERVQKKESLVRIVRLSVGKQTAHLDIHLGQSLLKGDKIEYVIQKSAELGVTAITPLIVKHGAISLSESQWAKKIDRWQKIALQACEQSGRSDFLKIHPPCSLPLWVQNGEADWKGILDPNANHTLEILTPLPQTIRFLVGPEGGFLAEELEIASKAGYLPTRMGSRIMRAETAPIVALSLFQYLWGDLGK